MAIIEPLRNHVVFQFEETKVQHMGVSQFKEKTDWGLEFVRVEESAQSPRWGIVTHVGPEVPDVIKPGMRVLIEKLKWTNEMKVGDQYYWRTDSDQILAYDEDHIPS